MKSADIPIQTSPRWLIKTGDSMPRLNFCGGQGVWGRTRPNRDRYSRRRCAESWRCRRWVGNITGTNDGPPEKSDHPLPSCRSILLNLVPKCARERTCPPARSSTATNLRNRAQMFGQKRFVLDQMAFSLCTIALRLLVAMTVQISGLN
jgi:hypothetical protein